MERIKCFLLEDTGEIVQYNNPIGKQSESLYRRTDTGETGKLDSFPAGAIYDADWYHEVPGFCGQDGKSWHCRTPGGDWCINRRASNCGLPMDDVHSCWVLHGEAPNFTVDKEGNTCNAGAGSIMIGGYHGFLRNGYLEPC